MPTPIFPTGPNDQIENLSHVEHKFIKSSLNVGTEAKAHNFVMQDPRFQKPKNEVKKAILAGLRLADGPWSSQSFDLIMTEPALSVAITADNVSQHLDRITMVEVKSTRSRQVQDVRLNGFFFGSTKTQYDLAAAAGDRLVFVYVVLTDTNAYGKPFFAIVPFSEVESRTRTKRIQYQVNFRTDMPSQGDIQGPFPVDEGA